MPDSERDNLYRLIEAQDKRIFRFQVLEEAADKLIDVLENSFSTPERIKEVIQEYRNVKFS